MVRLAQLALPASVVDQANEARLELTDSRDVLVKGVELGQQDRQDHQDLPDQQAQEENLALAESQVPEENKAPEEKAVSGDATTFLTINKK